MLSRLLHHLRTPLYKNTYVLMIARIASAGLGFVFWALAARLMEASDVGIASGYVTLAMLLAGLAQLGLGYGLVRHLTHVEDPAKLLNFVICAQLGAAAILIMLTLSTISIWSPGLISIRSTPLVSALFATLVFSFALGQLTNCVFLATGQLRYSLFQQVFQSVAAIGAIVVIVGYISGHLAAVSAYTISMVASIVIAFGLFIPRVLPTYRFQPTLRISNRTRFARYSLVNYLSDQLNRGPDMLLPLLVINYLGASAGAYFFPAWLMGKAVGSWAGSIADSLFAEGSRSHQTVAEVSMWRTSVIGAMIAGGLALAMAIGGGFILTIYGHDYFTNGIVLLFVVALAGIPTVLINIIVGILRIADRLGPVFVITALSNGGGTMGCYIGMKQLGMTGIGLGWLAAQMIVLLGTSTWWYWGHNIGTSHRHNKPATSRSNQ